MNWYWYLLIYGVGFWITSFLCGWLFAMEMKDGDWFVYSFFWPFMWLVVIVGCIVAGPAVFGESLRSQRSEKKQKPNEKT